MTFARVGGLPVRLLSPENPGDDEGWLLRLAGWLCGDLTLNTLVSERLAVPDLWGALDLLHLTPASELHPNTRSALEDAWRQLVEHTQGERLTITRSLDSLGDLTGDEADLLSELRTRLTAVPTLPDSPPHHEVLPELRRVPETLWQLSSDAEELSAMVRGAQTAARDRLADRARAAWARLLSALLEQGGANAPTVERMLRAMPALVLQRKVSLLEQLADETLPLDSPELALTAYLPLTPLRQPSPTVTVSGSAPPGQHRSSSSDLPKLSAFSQSLCAATAPSTEGLPSRFAFLERRDQLSRHSDVLMRGREWLLLVEPTEQVSLRMAALGEGLTEYAEDALATRKLYACRHYLRDALAALARAEGLADDTAARAFLTLVAVLVDLARDASSDPDEDVIVRRDDPERLFDDLSRRGLMFMLAREWAELADDMAADRYFELLCDYSPDRAETYRQCAKALLVPNVLRQGDRFAKRLLLLIEPAEPADDLRRSLHRLGEELRAAGANMPPHVRREIARLVTEIRTGLESLESHSVAPLGLIQEELPRLLEDPSAKQLGGESRITVYPLLGAFYPDDRAVDLELPVFVHNHAESALASDVSLLLGEPEGAPDVAPTIDKATAHIHELFPDDRREVRFWLRVPRDAAAHVAEWAFPIVVKTRDREQRSIHRIQLKAGTRRHLGSPYSTGRAVTGEGFIGRRRELDRVLDAVAGSGPARPVLLHGIRRIGKSSLLMATAEQAEVKHRYYPIYWSAEDRPTGDTSCAFLTNLTEKLRDALPDRLGTRLAFRREDFRDDPFAAFERFAVSLARANFDKRVLLLFDEVDKVFSIIADAQARASKGVSLKPQDALLPEVFGALRKCIMEHHCLNIVFAGLPISMRRLGYNDRLFGLLEPVAVGPFHEKEAEDVLEAGHQMFQVAPEAKRRLYDLCGLQPYLLQVVCQGLFIRMQDQGRDVVTVNDLDSVIHDLVLPNESYFADYLSLVTPESRRILWALAAVQRDLRTRRYASLREVVEKLSSRGTTISEEESQAALEALVARDGTEGAVDRPLVTRSPSNARNYRLAIGLIGEHLLERDF